MTKAEQTNEEVAAEIRGATERLSVAFGILVSQWMVTESQRGTEPAAMIAAFSANAAAGVSTIIQNTLVPAGYGAGVELATNFFRDDVVSMTAALNARADEPAVH